MKTKSLIKLICLVLFTIIFALWAFVGTSFPIFTYKLKSWDSAMIKSSELGEKYSLVYSIEAPKDSTDFDLLGATKNAVEVIQKRVEAIGYEKGVVKRYDNNKFVVELPVSEVQLKSGFESIFENNGVLEIKKGSTVLFSNADIKSAKIAGTDATGSNYYVDLTLTDAAKSRLTEITSQGAYTFDVLLDSTVVKAEFKGTETITNGVMRISFSYSNYNDAFTLAFCVDSGKIDGAITELTEEEKVVSASAGENVLTVLGLSVLVLFALAAVYFIVSNRFMGVAASYAIFIAIVLLEFFAATFTWLIVDAGAIAGFAVALLFVFAAQFIVVSSIEKQYAKGRDILGSVDNGIRSVLPMLAELMAIPFVTGIGLWICGSGLQSFGIAMLAGGPIAFVCTTFVFKFILKLFINLGADKASKLGLKRGE